MTAEKSADKNHVRKSKAVKITTLKKRRDFLALREGRKIVRPTMIVLALPGHTEKNSIEADAEQIRFGYTVTKRIGNAVKRNRIRRRFRSAVRQVAPELAKAGYDYVLIGRNISADAAFDMILSDLRKALEGLHKRKTHAGKPDGRAKARGGPMRPKNTSDG